MTRTALLAPALALALALSGCGSDDDAAGTPTPTPTVATSGCPGQPTTDLGTKPSVVLPAGTAEPSTTTFTDVVVGTGAEATDGSDVEVKYVGVLFSDCTEFDASWKAGPEQTLPFRIGGGVIAGFSKGVTGMKVGGRRQVVIPSQEGYGPQGSGPIPGGATLVFVVDLVKVG